MQTDSEPLARFAEEPVATLGTITEARRPHLVPITFALVQEGIVTMVDHKPKTSDNLTRLRNIASNGSASVMAHHYSDDWKELWWIRIDGEARVVTGGPQWLSARTALINKYPQYVDRTPEGPAIIVEIATLRSWASTP